MAAEPADVLIIGAGASGAVVALRLAEAGFKVVCLEQGEWLDRADYPGNKLDWELKARKDWATSPNIRGLAARLPDRRGRHPGLAAHVQRGRRLDDHLRRRLAARPAVRLPRPLARRDRRRLADRLLRAPAVLLPDRPPVRRVRAAGRPGLPARHRGRADAAAPDRRGRAQGRARRTTKLGWHWWPEFNSINSRAYDGRRPCVQRSTCQSGCNEGAKASTDLTHWPKAIALGARLDHRRPRPPDRDRRRRASRPARPGSTATAPSTSSRRASSSWRRTRSGRRGCCCSRPAPGHPDGLANSSGLVGKRLMMHPFANVAGLFEEPLMSWQGQFGDLIESLEFYETDEKRGFVRGARWGLAPDRRADQHRAPEPRRRAGLGPRAPRARPDPPRPRRELGPVRRGPARRGEPHHAVLDGHGLVGHPGARGPLPDGRQLAPDARLPHRAGEGVDGRGRRLQDRGRPADALLGLAPARHGADGRRPEDVRGRPLEPDPRRPEPVRRRRLVLRHLVRRQPDLDDRGDRAPGRRPHGRDAASSSRCRHDDAEAGRSARGVRRRRAGDPRGGRRPPDPGRARHALGGRGRRRRSAAVRAQRPARPDRAACGPRSGRTSATIRRRDSTRSARDEPANLGALQLAIVGGYYTDSRRPRADRLPGPDGARRFARGRSPPTSTRA